jgi:hypothetical protein
MAYTKLPRPINIGLPTFRIEKPSTIFTAGSRGLTFEGKQMNHGKKRLPPFERGRALPYNESRWRKWFFNDPGHRFSLPALYL